MEQKNEVNYTNDYKEESQLSKMMAFGIDGLGLTPVPKENFENKDIKADMKQEREK